MYIHREREKEMHRYARTPFVSAVGLTAVCTGTRAAAFAAAFAAACATVCA